MNKSPNIIGYVPCSDCDTLNELRKQKNGRFYANCIRGCLAHHRYNPDISDPTFIKGFVYSLPNLCENTEDIKANNTQKEAVKVQKKERSFTDEFADFF